MNKAISSNSLRDRKLTQIIEYHSHGNYELEKSQARGFLSSKNRENSSKSDVNSDNDRANASVVGNLQVNGQVYAIVEAKDTFSELKLNLDEILTRRELQVATLVTLGYSNKQVADRLKASEWSICIHLRRVFIKLGVTSRTAMIYCCASLIEEAIASSY